MFTGCTTTSFSSTTSSQIVVNAIGSSCPVTSLNCATTTGPAYRRPLEYLKTFPWCLRSNSKGSLPLTARHRRRFPKSIPLTSRYPRPPPSRPSRRRPAIPPVRQARRSTPLLFPRPPLRSRPPLGPISPPRALAWPTLRRAQRSTTPPTARCRQRLPKSIHHRYPYPPRPPS